MNPDKIKELKSVLEIVNTDRASKKEVAILVKQLIDVMREVQSKLKKDVEMSSFECQTACEEAKKALGQGLKELKGIVADTNKLTNDAWYKVLNGEVYKLEKLISEIPQFNSKPLEAKWSLVVSDLQKKIDTIKPFILVPTEVRDSLEKLEGNDRLDKSAIKGIEKIEEDIKSIELRPTGGGGSRGFQLYVDTVKKGMVNMVNFIAGTGVTLTYTASNGRNDITISGGVSPETPTGDINGSNTIFTFTKRPKVIVVDQGRTLIENNGFTLDATFLIATVTVAPEFSIFSV